MNVLVAVQEEPEAVLHIPRLCWDITALLVLTKGTVPRERF